MKFVGKYSGGILEQGNAHYNRANTSKDVVKKCLNKLKISKPPVTKKNINGEHCSQGEKFQESVQEGTLLHCDTAPGTPGAPSPHATNLRAQTALW